MPVRVLTCDVAIIGAGTAGLSARSAAARQGARTLLIEAGVGGTTCARVGCMPSKLLIAAGAAAHGARSAGLFGLSAGEVRVDGRAVMARVQRERDHFVAGVLDGVRRLRDDEKLSGWARFVGPNRLGVGDEIEIDAKAIVVATGSKSTVPKAFAACGDAVLTNESVFELPDLPASLAVIGAGPLGLELAQAFARLGVRVAVFDTGEHVGGLRDPAANEIIRRELARELTLHMSVETEAVPVAGGVEIGWRERNGADGREVFERVLVASGRPPNLDGLDLDRAGIELDDRGTPVFDHETMRCGTSSIFIAGDADADRPVLHEAADEGWIAGRNAGRYPDVQPTPRGVRFALTYTDPEIAVVGPPVASLDEGDLATGRADLAQSGRARVMGRNVGQILLHARTSDGLMLGGEIVGPEAEHLGHLVAWAVQLGLTAERMLDLPFYHPTLEESLRTALRDVCGSLKTHPTRFGQEVGPGA